MRSMLISLMVSMPAWATGEKVLLAQEAAGLRDSLCISMTCVSAGAHEVAVSARSVKNGVEFTVTAANGQVRLVHTAPARDGRVSSTDLMHASTLIVHAIEQRDPPPTRKAAVPARKLGLVASR